MGSVCKSWNSTLMHSTVRDTTSGDTIRVRIVPNKEEGGRVVMGWVQVAVAPKLRQFNGKAAWNWGVRNLGWRSGGQLKK